MRQRHFADSSVIQIEAGTKLEYDSSSLCKYMSAEEDGRAQSSLEAGVVRSVGKS